MDEETYNKGGERDDQEGKIEESWIGDAEEEARHQRVRHHVVQHFADNAFRLGSIERSPFQDFAKSFA